MIYELSRRYPTRRSKAEQAMYAIVDIAGKQFRVEEGRYLYIPYHEKVQPGEELVFDRVLLMADGDQVYLGRPVVEGAAVKIRVLEHIKADKVLVFKKKRRKRYKVKRGHRQRYTKVQVEALALPENAQPLASEQVAA